MRLLNNKKGGKEKEEERKFVIFLFINTGVLGALSFLHIRKRSGWGCAFIL